MSSFSPWSHPGLRRKNVFTTALLQSWAIHSPSTTGNRVLNAKFLLIDSYPKSPRRRETQRQPVSSRYLQQPGERALAGERRCDHHGTAMFALFSYLFVHSKSIITTFKYTWHTISYPFQVSIMVILYFYTSWNDPHDRSTDQRSRAKLLQYHWLYSPWCPSHPHDLLIL